MVAKIWKSLNISEVLLGVDLSALRITYFIENLYTEYFWT